MVIAASRGRGLWYLQPSNPVQGEPGAVLGSVLLQTIA